MSAVLSVAVSMLLAQVSPPEVVHRVDATYPPEELAQGHEGTVVLQVTVTADGAVRDVNVTESVSPLFDAAAIAAVLQWRFNPATRDGEAIPSRITIPVTFEKPASVEPTPDVAPERPVEAPPPSDVQALPSDVRAATSEPVESAGADNDVLDVTVYGKQRPASRGASDYQFDLGALRAIPRASAAEILTLAPGIVLTNDGGEGHAEQVFLRGFDAGDGQQVEFSVDGVPINEAGNLHGDGYSDTHFIIPELVESLRVIAGPFDPRQGNYAVAGSAEFHLGLARRGLTTAFTHGSFDTNRALIMYGSPSRSDGSFVAFDLYKTNGFGVNRAGQRGTVMAQVEGRVSESSTYRVTAQAYDARFGSSGILRVDDYRAGRIGFFGTYDARQGEDAARYSVSGTIETHDEDFIARNQFFIIYRPLRVRENTTGFLQDVQEPNEPLHGQRGDMIDVHNTAWTFGLKGMARVQREIFGLHQELEAGYFARADVVSSMQQRITTATNTPYRTDTALDSVLGDFGMYADANIKLQPWLTVRGGGRADFFTFDINDKIDPALNQRISLAGSAFMPRASLIVGPFTGLSVSASAGKGVHSIDPVAITEDTTKPYSSVTAFEGGLSYEHRVGRAANLTASTVVFSTAVSQDLVFSEDVGRNVLSPGTHRLGNATAVRFTGSFWDLAANATVVRARYDDTHDLVPYIPDLVVRGDGALFGALPWSMDGEALHASLSSGVSFIGQRPLPWGEHSGTVFTIDSRLIVGWRWLDAGVSVQNLLDSRYHLADYNYASDFHSQPWPMLSPARHFVGGAPRTVLFSLILNYGGTR